MRKNPFSRKNRDQQTATGGADATTTVDPAAVLGEPLAAKLAATVDRTPGLLAVLGDTASAVQPEDVDDPTVTVVGVIIDNTLSAEGYMNTIGQAHDELAEALLPALHEGVTILMTCSTLDGRVVYPLTRLRDVIRFGHQPVGDIREVPNPRRDGETVRVDSRGNVVAENGLTYNHMRGMFPLIDNTPLRDRVKEQLTALMAELLKWENPHVARTVNVISAVLTDGLDNSSKTPTTELSALVGEIEDGGSLTEVATFIGDVNARRFREQLVRNIVFNLIPEPELRSTHREMWVERFAARVLPEGHEEMTNEELLRWWFYEQGLAATADRLWLPGTDPKAIRAAVGQMSQVAFQASQGAFREEAAE